MARRYGRMVLVLLTFGFLSPSLAEAQELTQQERWMIHYGSAKDEGYLIHGVPLKKWWWAMSWSTSINLDSSNPRAALHFLALAWEDHGIYYPLTPKQLAAKKEAERSTRPGQAGADRPYLGGTQPPRVADAHQHATPAPKSQANATSDFPFELPFLGALALLVCFLCVVGSRRSSPTGANRDYHGPSDVERQEARAAEERERQADYRKSREEREAQQRKDDLWWEDHKRPPYNGAGGC